MPQPHDPSQASTPRNPGQTDHTDTTSTDGDGMVLPGPTYAQDASPAQEASLDNEPPKKTPPRQPVSAGDPTPWRTFFFTLGGSFFYLLSAVCILAGTLEILSPVFKSIHRNPIEAVEKFYCLGMLNVYEVMLIGVALLILLWKNVTDDAVSLTLLIAVFMVASAVTLDIIAPDFPGSTSIFGLVGWLLALAKLFMLARFVTGPFPRWLYPPLVLLLAWNFFMPALLGFAQGASFDNSELTQVWQVGWFVSVAAVFLMPIPLMRIRNGAAMRHDRGKPFLKTAGMRWIVLGILVLASMGHQVSILWAFYLQRHPGDFLFGLVAVTWLGMEIMRIYGVRSPGWYAFIGGIPINLAWFAITSGQYSEGPSPGLGFASYPPVVLLVTAALFAIPLLRSQTRSIRNAYGFLIVCALCEAVLFYGAMPNVPPTWNLVEAGIVAFLAGCVFAFAWRNAQVAWVAAAILALCCGFDEDFSLWLRMATVSPWAVTLMIFGLLSQFMVIVSPRTFGWRTTTISACSLAIGVMAGLPDAADSIKYGVMLIGPASAVLIVTFLAAWRSRHWFTLVPGVVPIGVSGYLLLVEHRGWMLMVLSFIVLAVGTVVSLLKDRLKDDSPPTPDENDGPNHPQGPSLDPAMPMPTTANERA